MGVKQIKNQQSGKKHAPIHHLSGTTWDVYLYILTSTEPVGVRDAWRNLKLSSPSLAQYHINKLLDQQLLTQTQDGKYLAKEKAQMETLRNFVMLRGKLIPRFVFYGALIAGFFAVYLVFIPLRWDARDLMVLTISCFSTFVFFFEAYIQYRSLKVAAQSY
ncbi:MAG: hypothetical protein JSV05_05630 [Candidatus Bathyarchaeota archaeon]|nr:MAG: hypothetical protein JSV05_05630 [Candidatus Bathyarchaeota archaeon]